MADLIKTPPISYPTVRVGGKEYQLKFGLAAMFRLNTWGVNVAALDSVVEEWARTGRDLQMVITLGSAALGHLVDEKWASAAMTPIQLADTLLDDEFQAFSSGVVASLGKASLVEKSATQPATILPTPAES